MINLLKTIKLSVEQYIIVTLVAGVGLLVLALRLQGSRLHKAKVSLLKERVNRSIELNDANVKIKRQLYKKAKEEYTKCSKKR
jgi:hypothetical protein